VELKPASKSRADKVFELFPALLVLGAIAVGGVAAGCAWGLSGAAGYTGLWAAALWLENHLCDDEAP
jgi:hypothetical protein